MNEIVERENLEENIDKLDAQRHLYSKAKSCTYLMFLGCVMIPVAFSVIKAMGLKKEYFVQITVFYSFMIVIIKPLFQSHIDSLRDLATRIQQLFDCEVFGLKWNDSLCGDIPTDESIYKAKTGENTEVLRDWYDSAVAKVERLDGIVICQRTNVVYDRELRKSWATFVDVGIIAACVMVFTIGCFQKLQLWDWFLNAIVPMSPIVSWYIDIRRQNSRNSEAIKKVNTLIVKALDRLRRGEQIEENNVEQIQNYIFLHRKSAYPIPDFIYRLKRDSSESAMQYSVGRQVDQLLQSKA